MLSFADVSVGRLLTVVEGVEAAKGRGNRDIVNQHLKQDLDCFDHLITTRDQKRRVSTTFTRHSKTSQFDDIFQQPKTFPRIEVCTFESETQGFTSQKISVQPETLPRFQVQYMRQGDSAKHRHSTNSHKVEMKDAS